MRAISYLLALASCILAVQGCASSRSGNVYSRDQARAEQTVREGVVERLREVQIEGRRSAVGAIGGGAIGGIAGSDVGKGKGSAISAVVGAIIGGVAGSTVEEKVTARPGLEITVRLSDDKLVAVVQEADEQFKVGERVRILSSQGVSRVTR